MASINKYTVNESSNVALGQAGAKFISDTEVHSGTFVAITMLEDTVFNALTPTDTTNGYGVGSYNGNTMASPALISVCPVSNANKGIFKDSLSWNVPVMLVSTIHPAAP